MPGMRAAGLIIYRTTARTDPAVRAAATAANPLPGAGAHACERPCARHLTL